MLVLRDNQQARVSIAIRSARGNPAVVDGTPQWSVSSAAHLEVVAEADGMAALVRALGPSGAAQVSVHVDADLGEGVIPVTGVLDVNVLSGLAAVIEISTEPPVDQALSA